MATVKPFRAWRPRPELAERICELPYDVMSTEEARVIAIGNPDSFLHISKPEIDLSPNVNPYEAQVYARGRDNFDRLIKSEALYLEPHPAYYLYRQIMGAHSQLGLVGAASCADYQRNIIKKHELTRPDKEEDRIRHIEALEAQTGPAFLVYRHNPSLEAIIARHTSPIPEIDFLAKDGVRHTAWTIRDPDGLQQIETEFKQMPALYIADGHHRSAAAARICQNRQSQGNSGYFLSVVFSANQVKILPYNRVLKDLNGFSVTELVAKLATVCDIKSNAPAAPPTSHEVALYLNGSWRGLRFRSACLKADDPVENLDASLLQKWVLAPIFGIDDPRTSQRIQFVGGIRGVRELERLVNAGQYACAFSLFPTSIEELMAVADAGRLMPPKSTWFEPKLRDGLFSYPLSS